MIDVEAVNEPNTYHKVKYNKYYINNIINVLTFRKLDTSSYNFCYNLLYISKCLISSISSKIILYYIIK